MNAEHRALNKGVVARAAAVFVLAVMMVGAAMTPVLADGWGHPKPPKYYKHRHHPGPRGYYYAPPPVVAYAPPPPPVVYAPPPPPPGINLVFPIHIR